MQHTFNLKHKNSFYLISFLLPFLIFETYFLSNNANILTVDLGQQYIDFLAFFKNNLFSHPARLIYNFNQGLGSSFIGTTAYYLTSPFNLVLFFLPNRFLPQAILVIIGLKIGSIGLTSYFYWQEKLNGFNKIIALVSSLAFALSGYVVAYNLNLMWLDSLILLPLLIKGIDQLFLDISRKNIIFLSLCVFLIWFTNFYTGYMILLFGALYYLWRIFCTKKIKLNLRKTLFPYIFSSLSGTLVASFLLIPTVYDLLSGKAQSTTPLTLTLRFPLWKLLSKFLTGTFSFSQMSHGLPNVYIPSILLLLVLSYFFNSKISYRAKISSFILLIFLIVSLSFTPLVLIWHLGQFPVWYPARQSFLLVFYLLNLTVISLATQEKLTVIQKIVLTITGISLGTYFFLTQKYFSFATSFNVLISCLLLICGILLIIFFNNKFNLLFLFALTAIETSLNLIISLNAISYQNNEDYSFTTQQVTKASKQVHDTNFYRLEKNFNRSDNDPLSNNYYGSSFFNSLSNQKIINFIDYLGLKNNDNSFENQYSTVATDSILGLKYYIISSPEISNLKFTDFSFRPSLFNKKSINKSLNYKIVKNNHALPLLFSSPNNDQIHFTTNNPTLNQTKFLNNITGKKFTLYKEIFWPLPQLDNVTESSKNWHDFSRINPKLKGNVVFTFIPSTNDPYYLELPPDVTDQVADLSIDHHWIDTSDLGISNHLIEIAGHDKNRVIKIKFTLNKNNLDLGNCQLWQFKQHTFNKELNSYLKNQPKIQETSPLTLQATFNSHSSTNIKSTIPYSKFWFVWDNHRLTKTNEFSHTFLSFKIKPGHHKLKLVYIPIPLIIGIIISLIVIIIFFISLHLFL